MKALSLAHQQSSHRLLPQRDTCTARVQRERGRERERDRDRDRDRDRQREEGKEKGEKEREREKGRKTQNTTCAVSDTRPARQRQ